MENTKKQTKKQHWDFQKWKAILILLLMGGSTVWAQNTYTLTISASDPSDHTLEFLSTGEGYQFMVNQDGVSTGLIYDYLGEIVIRNGHTLTMNFPNGQPIRMAGAMLCYKGNIVMNKTSNANVITLIRAEGFDGRMFYIGHGSIPDSECRLTINGYSNARKFIIDGGATFNTAYDARSGIKSYKGQGRIIDVQSYGGLDFKYVTIRNAYNDGYLPPGASTPTAGCAIVVDQRAAGSPTPKFRLENCDIRGCYAKWNGSAIHFSGSSIYENAELKNTTIRGCCSNPTEDSGGQGGTIRCAGSTDVKLTIDGGSIHDNFTGFFGGGIAWYAGGSPNAGLVLKNNVHIYNNEATNTGGGAYIGSKVDIQSALIEHNVSGGNGGGLYIITYNGGSTGATIPYGGEGLKVKLGSDVTIRNNTARNRGGGIMVHFNTGDWLGFDLNPGATYGQPLSADIAECYLKITGATIDSNKATYGAGVDVSDLLPKKHKFTRDKDPLSPYDHEWSNEYTRSVIIADSLNSNGTVFKKAIIQDNIAQYQDATSLNLSLGGGVCIEKMHVAGYESDYAAVGAGTLNVRILGGEIKNNQAIYNAGGRGCGGGFAIYDAFSSYNYESHCNLEISGNASIESNTATYWGGAFYVVEANVDIFGGSIKDNSVTGTLEDKRGGGFYIRKGNVNIEKRDGNDIHIQNNSVVGGNGGGIYAEGGDVTVNPGDPNLEAIKGNSAANGGAIYATNGMVTFINGIISDNYASERGGGLYIAVDDTLKLTGTAKLTRNHVPAAGEGGGVYLLGQLLVGSEGGTSSVPKTDAVIAEDNYADDVVNPTITGTNRNNVFLPWPIVNDEHLGVITIYPYGMALPTVSGGKDAPTTHVGFSVPRNYVPVIYCEDWTYLRDYKLRLEASVFDDSEQYLTKWEADPPYDRNYIYLSGILWTSAVDHDPGTNSFKISGNTITIKDEEGLAWLISYVNGRTDANMIKPHKLTDTIVRLDLNRNLDMGRYGWVPIGYDDKEFKGIFEGNGHTIENIMLAFGENQGVFGNVTSGARIKNLLVQNVNFSSFIMDTDPHYMGCIASILKGDVIVSGCGAGGVLDCLENSYGVVMGGLVGKIEADGANVPTIHSCYASTQMKGFKMGGLVGEMEAGNILNSFANPKFTYMGPAYTDPLNPSTAYDLYLGGFAAEITNGTFTNCYVREQTGSSHGSGQFGWFAGKYTAGAFNFCYAPENANYIHSTSTGTLGDTGYGWFAPTALVNGKYGFKHQDQDVTSVAGTNSYIENGVMDADGNLKGLLATLNKWVKTPANGWNPSTGVNTNGYVLWTRTMGSSVNDDYPVLRYENQACVGAKDGGCIVYESDINNLLVSFIKGNIYLYNPCPTINKNTHAGVRVYIEPNVGILQSTNSYGVSTSTLNARVGILFDNSSGNDLGGKPYDWHMFSPALSNAPVGLVYHSSESTYDVYTNYATYVANGIPCSVYHDRTKIDPPKTTWSTSNIGYFPTNTPYGTWRDEPATEGSFDFYKYSEPDVHWINFKREATDSFKDNWRDEEFTNPGYHNHIDIVNETELVPGRGYMMAVSEPTMLMANGTLNNGNLTCDVTAAATGYYDGPLCGVNLIGNPYQSYLDFTTFANDNASKGINSYYVLDADKQRYLAYTATGTESAETAPAVIHPHQGFFVKVASSGEVSFNNGQRRATGSDQSYFRGDNPRYPLVNLVCVDNDGRSDCAVVELSRPDTGGGEKIHGLRAGNASIWVHFDDADWHIAFTPVGTASVPVRFKAYADGVYTLNWSTENADFSYLHLIDNLTGADIDCMTTDKYVFEGHIDEYISRFKLVFDYTGVDENEDGTSTSSETFAFQMGDELMVNGEGTLQLFDVNGRLLMTTQTQGAQTAVRLPKVSVGVYVLRLTGDKEVKVQKMVIQ